MTLEEQIRAAARAAHEANRVYCHAIGDFSQAPWAEAPEWQRVSAVAGVRFIIENPDASPNASHDEGNASTVAMSTKGTPQPSP